MHTSAAAITAHLEPDSTGYSVIKESAAWAKFHQVVQLKILLKFPSLAESYREPAMGSVFSTVLWLVTHFN